MNLRSLKPGDTVECAVRGRVFAATYEGQTMDGGVAITPPRGISYHYVRKIDVKRRLSRA